VLLPVDGGNLALNAGGSHTGRGHKHEQSGIRPRPRGIKAIGADWALLSSLENVTYVSHFAVPIDFGATATLTLVPPLAFVSRERLPPAVCSSAAATKARESTECGR